MHTTSDTQTYTDTFLLCKKIPQFIPSPKHIRVHYEAAKLQIDLQPLPLIDLPQQPMIDH